MRRWFCILMVVALLWLPGCGDCEAVSSTELSEIVTPTEPSEEVGIPEQTPHELEVCIESVDYPYAESMLYEMYAWEFAESDSYCHSALQEKMMALANAPLKTETAITTFCQELYRNLTELGIMDLDYNHVFVDQFTDDIVRISYIECAAVPDNGEFQYHIAYDGMGLDALISKRDGHIIHLGILGKQKFRGVLEPAAEPLYLAFVLDEMSCQDYWGRAQEHTYNELATFDSKLQRKVEARELCLPLSTPQRVARFGEQIRNTLIVYGYIGSEDQPVFYMEHPNHMISICYNSSLSTKDGGIYVIVDRLSGRIAWICGDFGEPVMAG